MSLDPNILKTSIFSIRDNEGSKMSNSIEFQSRTSCQPNNVEERRIEDITTTGKATVVRIDVANVLKSAGSLSVSRDRRNISSPSINLQEVLIDPQSPSSSSSTSQATSANDATFEPTIEMMVNDFDDEQTLNEEEALAALESQDPDEEINTLKEESEMPLEELLSKYSSFTAQSHHSTAFIQPLRRKSKKSSSHKKKHKSQQKLELAGAIQTVNDEIIGEITVNDVAADDSNFSKHDKASSELNMAGIGVKNDILNGERKIGGYEEAVVNNTLSTPVQKLKSLPLDTERKENNDICENIHGEIVKIRRSHLFDLYPKGTFDNVVVNDAIAGNSKENLFQVEDDDDDEDEEIEEEDEDDDYKKKVMIGASYQATIPMGLSQYGDILPYENEDKLIWEPSQVSEREVEEYLLKIRDIKSNQQGVNDEEDEDNVNETNSYENLAKENGRTVSNKDNLENNSLLANGNKLHVDVSALIEMDNSQAVVKDNEQALHLLVQCGYDFKEALRRKRLNALPLNDCMSLWSEEECHKFEEGIQKYGKDFPKIRQNQVRTRTMRELVQFYYLWKKSERRDHNFANADTVDHMDIYLNEDNEYGSNPASVSTPVGSPVGNGPNCTATRRNNNLSKKNISIMTTTTLTTNHSTPTSGVNSTSAEKNGSSISLQQHHLHNKKRSQSNTNVMSNDFNNEISINPLTNFSK